MCIREIKPAMEGSHSSCIRCPRCNEEISRVAGFSAPMNLRGEESIRTKMPVRILKIDDGGVKFQSCICFSRHDEGKVLGRGEPNLP